MDIERSKSKKGLGIFLAILVILIVAVFGIYCLVLNKPKNIFLRNINNEYKKFSSLLQTDNSEIKTISTSMDFDFNVDVDKSLLTEEYSSLIEEINALNFKIDTAVDLKNKLLNLVLDLKYNEENLLNVGATGKPNSIYISLKDIYDKYIEIPYEEYENLFNEETTNVKDIEYVISKLKDSFLNSLDEKDFSKESETISINGNDVKVNKIIYILNEKKAKTITINVLKEVKEDSKFMNIISSLSDLTVEELKTEINDMIDELNEGLETSDTSSEVEIIMYTKGITNDAIKYVVKSNDGEISYSNYEDTIKVIFKDNEQTYLTLTNVKNSDGTYNTLLTIETIKVSITSNKENNTWTHSYKITESQSGIDIAGDLIINTKEVTKNKEYQEDLKLTMILSAENMKIASIEIKANATNKYNEEIVIPNVSNSVLYTEITEKDTNNILSNIMSNQTLVNFIDKISSLVQSSIESDDYYDDYYDDDYDGEL